MMDDMLRVAAVGVTAAVLAGILRKNTPELALLLVILAGVWMIWAVCGFLSAAVELMEELADLAELSEELVAPVLKTVALSILTRLTAEICRGSGEAGLAAFVETAGTVLALGAALPLVRAVTVLMGEMLG